MVKIKRMNKMLAVLFLSASMIFATGTTAFAYVDESAEASKTESVETEETEKDTVVEENQINTEEPFSVPGNAQVQDDITNSKNKEFLTITTKNNNTFYLIIDRSANVDNVYMLSQIDENDLQEFLEEDSSASTIVDVTPEVVIDENTHTEQTEQPATESPEKEGTASNLGALVAIFIAAILGVGAYGYIKFIKPKKDEDDGDDEGIEMIGESDPFEEDQESEDFDN
ncbi:CD1107 family mobile element protein [Bariatricus sp. HCP3S3_E12]|uniref:CD1107 family mobile element protein n=1 Tax=Bariatricus sp. HCP3S3_E12 TaxID=3438906 RepID=UPI003F8CD63D